jgi:hypothetical protein
MPQHHLDLSQIDERDEIDDGQQLCLVRCDIHRCHEWHWLELAAIDNLNSSRRLKRLNTLED